MTAPTEKDVLRAYSIGQQLPQPPSELSVTRHRDGSVTYTFKTAPAVDAGEKPKEWT